MSCTIIDVDVRGDRSIGHATIQTLKIILDSIYMIMIISFIIY
jgi:hypothetical protein